MKLPMLIAQAPERMPLLQPYALKGRLLADQVPGLLALRLDDGGIWRESPKVGRLRAHKSRIIERRLSGNAPNHQDIRPQGAFSARWCAHPRRPVRSPPRPVEKVVGSRPARLAEPQKPLQLM